ncbi:unnamed protein product [Peniophora sp. CBMAI 1063]|nr:unnamed protein product [Peniophora sp. CBMAI 1063]
MQRVRRGSPLFALYDDDTHLTNLSIYDQMPAKLNISVCFGSQLAHFRVSSTYPVQKLLTVLSNHIGVQDVHKLRFMHNEGRLEARHTTLEQAGIQDGDCVDCWYQQGGGFAPDGICISSPTEIPQVALEVSLPQGLVAKKIFRPGQGWSINPSQVIEWRGSVSARRGYDSFSELVERDTGGEGAGIFWCLSRGPSGVDASVMDKHFALDDDNSVVLAYNEVSSYLEQVLRALSLDANVRECFFLSHFWNLIRTRYIAIRFLDQGLYEELVPLALSPPPDVITRIVMVFQRLDEADVAAWPNARERKELGPEYWKEVTGVDERALDILLYRALEWRVVMPTADDD